MADDTKMTRTERQAAEIQAIINEHTDEIVRQRMEGQALLEARAKCSRAIAEAVRRHLTENNSPDVADAGTDDDAGQGEHAADTGEPALPGSDMVR